MSNRTNNKKLSSYGYGGNLAMHLAKGSGKKVNRDYCLRINEILNMLRNKKSPEKERLFIEHCLALDLSELQLAA